MPIFGPPPMPVPAYGRKHRRGARLLRVAAASATLAGVVNPLWGAIPPPRSLLLASSLTGLSDGASVPTWADSAAGDPFPATNAAPGTQPVYRARAFGGHPCVRFTAGPPSTGRTLSQAMTVSSRPFTLVLAVQMDTAPAQYETFLWENARTVTAGKNFGFGLGQSGSGSIATLAMDAVGSATSPGSHSLSVGVPTVIAITSPGSGAGTTLNAKIYTLAGGTAYDAVSVSVSGQTASGAVTLGAPPFNNNALVADMAGVADYPSELAPAEVVRVMQTLAVETGVPVTSPARYATWQAPRGVVLASPGVGTFDAGRVEEPEIYFDGTNYHVWYAGWNAPGTTSGNIGYASGPDLYRLTKRTATGVIPLAGGFRAYASGPRFYTQDGVHCYLFFFGSPTAGFEASPGSIYVATSSTGPAGPWTAGPTPLVSPGASGAWDDSICYRPDIVYSGGTYYLFYNAKHAADTREQIGYAAASRITGPYTKYAGNPVIHYGTLDSWEGERVGDIDWQKLGGTWYGFYFGQATAGNGQMGIVTAPAITGPYTKYAGNPIEVTDPYGQTFSPAIRPALFHDAAGNYRMLFDDVTATGILAASLPTPAATTAASGLPTRGR